MTAINFDVLRHRMILDVNFRCSRCGEHEWLVLEKEDESKPFSEENAKLVCMECEDQKEKLHIVNLIYDLLDSLCGRSG